MASKRIKTHEPLSARGWTPVVRAAIARGPAVSGVCVRSGYPGSVPDASHLAYVSRARVAHLGGCRPALRRSSPGCAFLRERAPGSRLGRDGSAGRGLVRVEFRNGFGFYCEADLRLSA